jgi:hypothetical protein
MPHPLQNSSNSGQGRAYLPGTAVQVASAIMNQLFFACTLLAVYCCVPDKIIMRANSNRTAARRKPSALLCKNLAAPARAWNSWQCNTHMAHAAGSSDHASPAAEEATIRFLLILEGQGVAAMLTTTLLCSQSWWVLAFAAAATRAALMAVGD